MCDRSQACRATAQGRADSLARRSGKIRKLVWRVSRATDAPLLVTAPLRAGDEACPASVTSGGAGGGPLACTWILPRWRHHEVPASCQRRLAARHARTALWRLPRDEGRCERPPGPGMAHQRPLAAPRDCTRVHKPYAVPLAHRAYQARHRVASSSKVGSGMPACQVGSRNSSRLPLGSKKYSSRPGKTPSFR
jgi:hypothetical protein